MCSGLTFTPSPEKILIMGLGGGFLAKFYMKNAPSSGLDIVDIRPILLPIAQKYFGFRLKKNTRFFVQDAFDFIRSKAKEGDSYDLIIVDICLGGDCSVDTSLKEQFWKDIAKCLKKLATVFIVT